MIARHLLSVSVDSSFYQPVQSEILTRFIMIKDVKEKIVIFSNVANYDKSC